jgi:hypothetical protein
MATLLMPCRAEISIPVKLVSPGAGSVDQGRCVLFATPDGEPGEVAPWLVTGKGLGRLAPMLKADRDGRGAYGRCVRL